MKVQGWLAVGLGIALAAVVLAIWITSRPAELAPPLPKQVSSTQPATDREEHAPAADSAAISKAANPGAKSLALRFRDSKDYLALASSIIGAAQAGDGEAQFYLSEILHYCSYEYRAYFTTRGPDRTLEEAKARARSTFGLSESDAEQIYERCRQLVRETSPSRFGTEREWLDRSAATGFPQGQLKRAKTLFMQADAQVGGMSNLVPEFSPPPEALRKEARELVDAALKASAKPEVLWEISEMAKPLSGGAADSSKETWAWKLAACQRGYDCSANARWVQFICRNDKSCELSQDGVDLIRSFTQDDFTDVSAEAQRIDSMLNAGKSGELLESMQRQ